MADPDLELVRRIADGDARASEQLVRKRMPGILALARRILGDPVEAEDVAQETFLRVWREAGRWRPTGAPFHAWMCRVTTNLCLDRLRKKRELQLDLEQHDRPGDAPSPAAGLAQAQRRERVEVAMANLPDRQRTAIALVHFEELTNIQAAEILEISVEALESLLARGRRALKAALQDVARDLMGDPEGAR